MFSECKLSAKGCRVLKEAAVMYPFWTLKLALNMKSTRVHWVINSCKLLVPVMKSIAWNHCLLIALFFWIVSAVMIVGSDQCAKHITPSAQVNTVSGHTAKPPLLLCSLLLQRTDDNSKEKSILRRQIITGERESYFSWERDKGFGLRQVMTHWTSYGNHFRADSGGCGL